MGLKAISGKNGKHGQFFITDSATFGTVQICVEEWTLRELIREEETTNSCSQGKEEYEYGTKHCDITIRFTLDLSQHPLDDPPGFTVGSTLPGTVYLTEHSTAAFQSDEVWQFPVGSLKVTELSLSVPAIGKVLYEISLRSSQNYIRPYEQNPSGV